LIDAHQHQDPSGGFNIDNWTTNVGGMLGPRQINGYDCGVFMSAAAHHLLLHDDFSNATFEQHNMPYWQRTIAEEIEPWWHLMNPYN